MAERSVKGSWSKDKIYDTDPGTDEGEPFDLVEKMVAYESLGECKGVSAGCRAQSLPRPRARVCALADQPN